MNVQMDETFSAALRDLLVEQVQQADGPSRWFARPRRWIAGAGAALVLAVTGGGIAYAIEAFTSTQPGGDAVSDLAAPVSATGIGTETVKLGARPAGATSIYMAFTGLTAGDFTFADGASGHCDGADVGRRSAQVTYTMTIPPGQDSTRITATTGARWRLLATYVSVTTTAWAVNASGQTYGVQNQRGTPDLIAVTATNHRTGYVYAHQLNPPPPKTIKQALAQNNAAPKTLTVYESDGKTPIGKFALGP
ncbi:MAG: hypothetical protein ACRDNS_04760 [Trebonia sp.]